MTRPPSPPPLRVPVVDTHCHLDLSSTDDPPWPVDLALAQACEAGVTRVVQVGCDVDGARWAADLASRRDDVVAAVALHPNEAPRLVAAGGAAALDAAFGEIERLAAVDRVRAVGETGLDHFRTGEDGRDAQEHAFRLHIDLAKRLRKPLVIHDRDAHDDVIRVLEEEGPPQTVVFHCFSGDAAMAAYCATRGWYLSFAGPVTFRNAAGLRDALDVPPLDLLLVETDAPYLTPMPFRGRPNSSYLVPLTVRAMAEVRDVDEDTMAQALSDNAERVFGPW